MQVPQCIVKSIFSYKKNTLPAARLGIKLELSLLKDGLCINIQMRNYFAQTRFLTMQLKHFLNFQITLASFLLGFKLEMPLEATGNSGFQLASELSHPHFKVYPHEILQALKLKVFQVVCMRVDSYLKPLLTCFSHLSESSKNMAIDLMQILLHEQRQFNSKNLFFKRGF